MRFFILLEGDILARMTDEAYMQRALELALQAEGNTSPNPMVGCVIVDAEGNIVGDVIVGGLDNEKTMASVQKQIDEILAK